MDAQKQKKIKVAEGGRGKMYNTKKI